MKKINLLLITTIMVFYFGCDNNPALFTDCNGFENGLSIEDNCGICDEDPTNNCIQDCNGNWGGSDGIPNNGDEAFIDECGTCGGNGKLDCNNNCIFPNVYGNYFDTGINSGLPLSMFVDCFGVCQGMAVVDECNICNGPGEVYLCGCSGIEEGKCDCQGNINGCDGVCNSGIVEDCSGLCGGNLVFDKCGECNGSGPETNLDCSGNCIVAFDDCGICGGDGTTCNENNFDSCNMPNNNIYMIDGAVYYNMDFGIKGFQFNIDGDTASNANGGDAAVAGFIVSAGGSTILGFSFTGAAIPAGCGILTQLELDGNNATGLSNLIFDDGSTQPDILYYQP